MGGSTLVRKGIGKIGAGSGISGAGKVASGGRSRLGRRAGRASVLVATGGSGAIDGPAPGIAVGDGLFETGAGGMSGLIAGGGAPGDAEPGDVPGIGG